MTCLAIRTGANALNAQSLCRTLCGPAVDGPLTRPISAQRLSHEHRQHHCRRIQPLPMLGQIRLGCLKQFWTREQIEKIHRMELASALPNAFTVLLQSKIDITISHGWPRDWWGGCLVTNILPIPANLLLTFRSLSLTSSGVFGLSKCHSCLYLLLVFVPSSHRPAPTLQTQGGCCAANIRDQAEQDEETAQPAPSAARAARSAAGPVSGAATALRRAEKVAIRASGKHPHAAETRSSDLHYRIFSRSRTAPRSALVQSIA